MGCQLDSAIKCATREKQRVTNLSEPCCCCCCCCCCCVVVVCCCCVLLVCCCWCVVVGVLLLCVVVGVLLLVCCCWCVVVVVVVVCCCCCCCVLLLCCCCCFGVCLEQCVCPHQQVLTVERATQPLRLIELITCVMSSPTSLKAPKPNRRPAQQGHRTQCQHCNCECRSFLH